MASPATLATMGSSRTSHGGAVDCCPSSLALARIRVVSRISFSNCRLLHRRWPPAGVCKCMVRTDLMEKGALETTIRSASGGQEDASDVVLKPSPKPVLSASPPPWRPAKPAPAEDRDKVIESLGEVLEKAEKLSSSSSPSPSPPRLVRREPKPEAAGGESAALRKSKTLKSVWRKGSPTANVEKVVREVQKPPSSPSASSLSSPSSLSPSAEAPARPPFRPANLQARPVAATAKKAAAPAGPILIDKFASKKGGVDPIIEQAVLAVPVKPGKGPAAKGKDERRRKTSTAGGLRRRLAKGGDIGDELDVSIPGAAGQRTGRKWSKASRKAAKLKAMAAAAPVKVEILEVGEEGMLLEELAYNLAVPEAEILSYLFSKGVNPDEASMLSKELVKMLCKEYEVEVIEAEEIKVEQMARKKEVMDEEDLDSLETRPPVITIMGHVDHGKTTLLDYIRKSKVVASEAGGITQGIGAYTVGVPFDGEVASCVFLDTPGHEAFGAMRARGARVTDIAIIVVAADDGVRPQTREAIAHAQAAEVPIIVAINKIDKDGANPDRVMQELSSIGLMPEDWGGSVPMVQISALKGENVDDLLETVMLVAELQELKANPHRKAKGVVIEAGLEKSKGPVATFIVQKGTLKKSDVIVCGEAFGKVRALFDDRVKRVDNAGPSMAVQVIGLNNVPVAGDEFEVVESLDIARERAEACAMSLREARISAKGGEGKVTLSSIASAISASGQSGLDRHQLNIVLKVDLQGSIEAVRQAIQALPQDNVILKFLLQASGDVTSSDVDLAVAAEGIIIGFNVKAAGSVKSHADRNNVEIRLYRVIYDLVDDLRKAMEGLLEPVEEQVPIGTVEVRKVFSSGSGRVAGCMVTEGKAVKGCGIRVLRRGKLVYEGVLDSLRRVKEEVKEVGAGLECGIGVDEFLDWEDGDVVQAFNAVKRRRTLEEASASVAAAISGAGVQL
ncbi:translation initiation factor 2, small GTP-binding protein [Wolffia australiana]